MKAMNTEVKNIIIMGPQGSGKGTQAKLLAQKYGLFHLEMGKVLRAMGEEKSKLGKEIHTILKHGGMVPFELVVEITKKTVAEVQHDQGIVFDGTPRRQQEIEPLMNILKENNRKLTHVFLINVPKEESIRRLSMRRVCTDCHTPAIAQYQNSDTTEACKKCGGKLMQRADDTPLAIEKRLTWSKEQIQPVEEYFRTKGELIIIDGMNSIEAVNKEVEKYL